jgi:Rer1 family
VLFALFVLRIIVAQGWYIVAYTLGIYLLNIFLAFITPKFDPSLEQDEGMEDGTAGGLPTKQDDEFRPFVRRLPEFKFWHSATRAIVIGILCSFFRAFDLPVFWPILVMYWFLLFILTSTSPLRLVARLTKAVRRQIQHMIKYRYVPFTVGKMRYGGPGK